MTDTKMKELRKTRQAALDSAKVLTDAARAADRGMTTAEQTDFNRLLAEADEAKVGIEQQMVGAVKITDTDDGWRYPDAEQPRRSGGRTYRELFGANTNSDGWQSKGEFLRCVGSGMFDQRLRTAGMNESAGSTGGFLLPSALAADLLDTALESEIVRPRADIRPMTTSELRVSGLDSSDHTQLFGFSSEWLEEGGTATLQTPLVRQILLRAKKNILLTSLTNELAADLASNAQPKLWDALTQAVGFSIDDVLLNGSGAGQPQGALKAASVVVIDPEAAQVADTIVVENITKMAARLYPPCFARAVWVTHPSALPQLLTLQTKIRNDSDEVVGGGQSGLLQGDGRGGYTLLSRPLLISEKMQPVGDRGDLALIDFSQYIVGVRREISLETSSHAFFSSDKLAVRCIIRLDGQASWASAITPKNGTDSLSWAVCLAARSS